MGSLWNRSGTVERYADDIRAAGAQAFFFQGGTTSPLTVYRDAGASSAHSSPVLTDANGRWPDVFVPYTIAYDVQVLSADNVQLTYSLQIPNPDPVQQTVTIPPANQVQTGMIHFEFVNATKTGFVRLNGRTIGTAATSGPTSERANGTNHTDSDCFALFSYLYSNLTNAIAPVSGGRGASAVADFDANKTIVLPDMRGAGPIGLDDMGSSAAGLFGGLTFAVGNTITAGSLTGVNGVTLDSTNMPPHSHVGTTNFDGAHTHAITPGAGGVWATGLTGNESVTHVHALIGNPFGNGAATAATGIQSPQNHTHTIGTGSGTGGAAQYSGFTLQDQTGTHSSVLGTTINVTGNQSVDHTHALSGNTSGESATHIHAVTIDTGSGGTFLGTATTATAVAGSSATITASHSHAFSTDVRGGLAGVAQQFNNLGLSRLVTWFIKL